MKLQMRLHISGAGYFSGLVAGVYPNPLHFADVVTSTTHKTQRGAQEVSALTMKIYQKKSIRHFSGLRRALMHVIAAKA